MGQKGGQNALIYMQTYLGQDQFVGGASVEHAGKRRQVGHDVHRDEGGAQNVKRGDPAAGNGRGHEVAVPGGIGVRQSRQVRRLEIASKERENGTMS